MAAKGFSHNISALSSKHSQRKATKTRGINTGEFSFFTIHLGANFDPPTNEDLMGSLSEML